MKKLFILILVLGGIGGGLYFSGGHQIIMEKLGMSADDDGDEESSEDYSEEPAAEAELAPEPVAMSPEPAAAPKTQRKYWEKPGFRQWNKYKKILIDPVKVNSGSSAMASRDQQMLGEYFHNAMRNAAQRRYRVVNAPGPDVLRVRTSIKNVTGDASGKGTVTMQGKLLDSLTGSQLVTIQDTKSGSLFSSTALWGDITKGFDNWAEQLYGLLSNKLGNVQYAAIKTEEGEKIMTLLTSAEQDLFSNRLTSPAGKNALEKYRRVIMMDSSNQQAKKGIEKIVKKYASWGERAVIEGNTKRAWIYLDKARDILDEHPAVKRLAASLRGGMVPAAAGSMVVAAPVAAPAAAEPAPAEPATDTAAAEPAAAEPAAAEPAPAAPEATPQVAATDPWGGKPGQGSASFTGNALKPFMLGLDTTGDVKAIAAAAKTRLTKAGFEVVGEYSPYATAHIITATSSALKSEAAKSKFGGYGAVIRVAITSVGERIQVSYTNPVYYQYMYRMSGNLSAIANKLGSALGHEKAFGSKKGIAPKKLKKWRYMFGMPYFDDADKLGSGSHSAMVSKIESKLGSRKVYRIDIPGKKETIIGVAIKSGKGSDATVMKSIDTASNRHTAHLPYEILISNGTAYALNGKFRIALSFPDLTMGQFASIKSAPGAIKKSLKAATK